MILRTVRFEPQSKWGQCHEGGARSDAKKAGWSVRPGRGKGSRSAPDLCPEHTTD